MNSDYYDMIFKRKSFHVFKETIPLTKKDLEQIEDQIKELKPLVSNIKVEFRIVEKSETTCKRGEYCILIYSEKMEHCLQNVGYMGEQLDLWLTSNNIGVCWYGVGETIEPKYNGLDFVIMMAIAKTKEEHFRKDYTKSKRKSLPEIWGGKPYLQIADAIRYAPSACNTQPWFIEYSNNQLFLYRVLGRRGIMPQVKVSYYNRIDIGIMMCFLETCLYHEGVEIDRELFPDTICEENKVLNAIYRFVNCNRIDNQN